MARRTVPRVEGLEGRTLLSALSYSLTTDQSVYQVGQPIEMTFTETNASNQPVTVEVSPTDFTVSQSGSTTWQSDPANAGLAPTSETLQPGQSLSQTASWDGTSTDPYNLTINNCETFIVSNPNAPWVRTAFQITDPITYSLTTDQSVYQAGQPIGMTFTETNVSNQPVTVEISPTDFTVSQWVYGLKWQSDPANANLASTSETLQPGQSVSQTASWDGMGTDPPFNSTINIWGTFTVSNPNAPSGLTTTFQITDPITYSLTTDQSVYQAGQPIEMTFTETNVSNQPVTVEISPTDFSIWAIWQSDPANAGLAPTSETLQPGQSVSQTASWDGTTTDPSNSTINIWGSFTVSNPNAPWWTTAAFFQITDPITYSLTTDQPVYQARQPIGMTFTETNVSDQPVTVEISPTDFTVSQWGYGLTKWQSDPANANLASTSETLQPGQSVSQTASWDGMGTDLPFNSTINLWGTFTVTASNPNAPRGLTTTFQITDPITYSLTTDQSVYQAGQPVQMTFTETNTSDQAITVEDIPAGFTIFQNETQVLFDILPASEGPFILQAGQSITDTQTWDGIPAYGPYTTSNLTGTFVVDYGPGYGPFQFTTSFQITLPAQDNLVTSVTTDQAVYNAGQPVNLTFTETNDGTQPVPILIGSPQFQITQDGTLIWDAFSAGSPASVTQPSWLTLQPGQSYSQTATWNGLPTSGGPSNATGQMTASYDLDPNPDTASFEYLAPPSADLSTSLTTDQSSYQLGQPIELTFTETNVGTTAVQVLEGTPYFEVLQDGCQVWNSLFPYTYPGPFSDQIYSWVSLQPGQSLTQTATWNGVPDQLPSGDSSGTFTVSDPLDPRGETTTFQIVAPSTAQLTTSVTTYQSAYAYGQPVVLTFTETNNGSQAIAVLTGPTAFEVAHNGTTLWDSTSPISIPSASSWETLQPGQSYTQSTIMCDSTDLYDQATMYDNYSTGAVTFFVFNLLDPNYSFATFQIRGPLVFPICFLDSPITNPTPIPPIQAPITPIQTPISPIQSPTAPITPIGPIPNPVSSPSSPISSPVLATLSTDQGASTTGQSVQLSLILKDMGTQQVAVATKESVAQITVLPGSTEVVQASRSLRALRADAIKPGHIVTLTTVWSRRANQAAVKKLSPGTYSIRVDYDG